MVENYLVLGHSIHKLPTTNRKGMYLIAFQNPAEARGTGGIIGRFTSIQIANVKLTVMRVGSNAQLMPLPDFPDFISKDFRAPVRE